METEIVTHGQRRSHLGNLSNIGRLPLPLSGFQVIRTLNAILISPTRKLAQQLFFFVLLIAFTNQLELICLHCVTGTYGMII